MDGTIYIYKIFDKESKVAQRKKDEILSDEVNKEFYNNILINFLINYNIIKIIIKKNSYLNIIFIYLFILKII